MNPTLGDVLDLSDALTGQGNQFHRVILEAALQGREDAIAWYLHKFWQMHGIPAELVAEALAQVNLGPALEPAEREIIRTRYQTHVERSTQ